jgi:NAD(P)-dependent dehydrogenase (short-subunit alcohol dehydrogenase family)
MYQVFKNKWVSPPKPVHEDYSGFNIIVTGATSGIGEEAAYKFAALGASKVIMTARDMEKGESTKASLEARLQDKGQLEVWELDLMSYDSVKAFANRASELDHLDIVILNAGTRRTTFHQTSYGWEEDLQVNTLSTTLLALLLLPSLRKSVPAGSPSSNSSTLGFFRMPLFRRRHETKPASSHNTIRKSSLTNPSNTVSQRSF